MIQIDIKVENRRVREELEKDMKYLLEEKAELEREIRVGKQAEKRLSENTKELEAVTTAWLGCREDTLKNRINELKDHVSRMYFDDHIKRFIINSLHSIENM